MARDGGLHGLAGVDDRDLDPVAELGERDVRALAQAVVRRDEEEHPQRPCSGRDRQLAAEGARVAPEDLAEIRCVGR
jgi:hypothetical protein